MRDKLGRFKKGEVGFWEGKKRPNLKKTGASKTMFKKGDVPWDKGIKIDKSKYPTMGHNKPHSSTTRRKISVSKIGSLPWNKGKHVWPDPTKHPMWKGGITSLKKKLLSSLEYRNWRKTVLLRDNYTCQVCGFMSKKGMHVDHIKQRLFNPDKAYDPDNGRVLCFDCHKLTPTYSRKHE